MRIYISGPMAGKKNNNRAAFTAAEKQLFDAGHTVLNPASISTEFGTEAELAESFAALYYCEDHMCDETSVEDYIEADLKCGIARAVMEAELAAVRSCDAIYLLRGWENSRGAKKELAEAIKYGLKILLEGRHAEGETK